MTATPAPEAAHRKQLTHGIAWNGAFQLFQTLLGFGVTMVLARLMPPTEYGRSTAVVGCLALVNAFGAHVLVGRALQLGDDVEPDWPEYFAGALWLQGLLALVCELLAAGCWLLPVYRPIAPLLHLAGLGVFLDGPAHFATVMLRRNMDFRRLRILGAIAAISANAVTVTLGLLGVGAFALVLGANVLLSVPLVIDLIFVRRFRPRGGWLRRPDLGALRPAVHFGLQQGTSALLWAARAAVPAAVLPTSIGYAAIGLLNRATGLYLSSAGRVVSVLLETVYPLLPRYARDRERYPAKATLLLQGIVWVTLPAALFLGLEGAAASRFLYGQKWVAADPAIFPSALGTLGVLVCSACASVLLATDRLRTCLLLDVAGALIAIPTVAVTWLGGGLAAYAWALGGAQLVGAALSLVAAAPLLERDLIGRVLVPPAIASLFGVAAVWLVEHALRFHSAPVRLGVTASAFGALFVASLRLLHGRPLSQLLAVLPAGPRLARLLALSMDPRDA